MERNDQSPYLSRTLSKAEENYSSTAKEFFGIYFAAESFRPRYGRQTANSSRFILNLKLTVATGRVTRQRLCHEHFNLEIVYKKGKLNVVADCLSRISRTEINLQEFQNEIFENAEIYGPETINKLKNQLIFRCDKIRCVTKQKWQTLSLIPTQAP